jgi:two-component system, OmpR family, alkaline phosphatase synthesis response regulator PhoP
MPSDHPNLIYIIEDDAVIAELLEYNLQNEGFAAKRFPDGSVFFSQAGHLDVPDLFILDLMLPGIDGYEICRRLRDQVRFSLVPILILTARGSESDKVLGLETGADDYLTKPFGMRELMARVRALLRRYRKLTDGGEASGTMTAAVGQAAAIEGTVPNSAGEEAGRNSFRDIVLDDARHRVFKAGQEVEMTNREYELLKFLMTHPGIAFNRDDLLSRVWGYDYAGETRTVDVHIRQLRRKLEDEGSSEALIETVRGRGYRWSDKR